MSCGCGKNQWLIIVSKQVKKAREVTYKQYPERHQVHRKLFNRLDRHIVVHGSFSKMRTKYEVRPNDTKIKYIYS